MNSRTAQEVTAAPTWVLPEEPVPVRLMNTIWADRRGVHDALTTQRDLAAWLQATGAGTKLARRGDLALARRLRNALRRLAALSTADSRPAAVSLDQDLDEAVREVNATAEPGRTTRQLHLAGGVLRRVQAPADPTVRAALSKVAMDAVDLLSGADGTQLRACPAPGCVLYFVKDHPRRAWCSTGCGNRARAARHYRRHRPSASGPAT